jgi:hypothetical protein
MSLDDKILDPIVQATNSMIANNELSIETATRLMAHINNGIAEGMNQLKRELEDKIHLWDSMYGGADKSLYTLGLRHALDIVKGEVATDTNGFNGKPYVEGQEFELDEVVEDI